MVIPRTILIPNLLIRTILEKLKSYSLFSNTSFKIYIDEFENAYEMAKITAYETRAASIPWNFSPVLDLGQDSRFPRQFET